MATVSLDSRMVETARTALRKQGVRGTDTFLTMREVADETGHSISTIKRWRTLDEAPQPSHIVPLGKSRVAFYTRSDVKALVRWAKTLRPGPKPKDLTELAVAAKRRSTAPKAKAKKTAPKKRGRK